MLVMYVMFRDANGAAWYKRFLKKGFGHCSILLKEDKKQWIYIDPLNKILNAKVYSNGTAEIFLEDTKQTVLRLEVDSLPREAMRLGIYNCVGILQYVIGKNLGCITPYGLYKKLTGKYRSIFHTVERSKS